VVVGAVTALSLREHSPRPVVLPALEQPVAATAG
jgi:hypothetical protein